LYYVPLGTIKYDKWVDGFTSAMDIIDVAHQVSRLNMADHGLSRVIENVEEHDIILIKSNWGARIDRYAREYLKQINTPIGLLISGSKPPDAVGLKFYDLLFYETTWYLPYVASHDHAVLAFGVNTDIMKPYQNDRSIDWLTVGQFKKYKRMHYLLDKKGTRLAVGEEPKMWQLWKQEWWIYQRLRMSGIKTLGFQDYHELARIYNDTNNLLIAASLHGGGERAIMEAKACEVPNIEIAKDNPKLQSVLDNPVLSHYDYANQILKGVDLVL